MNSLPSLLLKDKLSPPKTDETMQPQSESPENQLDVKDASSKEILNYSDKFEWKPGYVKNLKMLIKELNLSCNMSLHAANAL